MSERVVAIGLRIPDNEAYTALVTLQRMGLPVARLERSEMWRLDDCQPLSTLAARVESNETMFNPNKHRLIVLEGTQPRDGETWIEPLERHDDVRERLAGKMPDGVRQARRSVAWRLFDANAAPAAHGVVERAAQMLLCNPAIERAVYGRSHGPDVEKESR